MNTQKIYLSGGCFWGLEELMRSQTGVVDTEVGYAGGQNDHPSYPNHPGHAEALEVTYNADETTYESLLDYFFRVHDPTTMNKQGNDIGSSYRSAIFYQSEDEKQAAQAFIDKVNTSGKWNDLIVTTLEPFTQFWPAEEDHQDYLQKNPGGYTCHYLRFEDVFSE